MRPIRIALQADEREALARLAGAERRDPRVQAALIIRDYLLALGLLPVAPTEHDATRVESAEVRNARGA